MCEVCHGAQVVEALRLLKDTPEAGPGASARAATAPDITNIVFMGQVSSSTQSVLHSSTPDLACHTAAWEAVVLHVHCAQAFLKIVLCSSHAYRMPCST